MSHKPPLTGAWGKPLTPATTRVNGSPASATAGPGGGLDAIYKNAGAINQFVAKQRRLLASGIIDVAKGHASFDGVDVAFQSQFGLEKVTYTPHPAPPGLEATLEEATLEEAPLEAAPPATVEPPEIPVEAPFEPPGPPEIPVTRPLDLVAVEFYDGIL